MWFFLPFSFFLINSTLCYYLLVPLLLSFLPHLDSTKFFKIFSLFCFPFATVILDAFHHNSLQFEGAAVSAIFLPHIPLLVPLVFVTLLAISLAVGITFFAQQRDAYWHSLNCLAFFLVPLLLCPLVAGIVKGDVLSDDVLPCLVIPILLIPLVVAALIQRKTWAPLGDALARCGIMGFLCFQIYRNVWL